MISHKHKIIFIHVPKCAGTSIKDYYFDTPNLDWKTPNYEQLYGWCPKRKLHMQHATPKELLETELITEKDWSTYFKFAFVRNPWSRSYSDYIWIQKDRQVTGNFKDYLMAKGPFKSVLSDNSQKTYRGDHLTAQVDYVADQNYPLDFVGKFETLQDDIKKINKILGKFSPFDVHAKNNTKHKLSHYSEFYTKTNQKLIEKIYQKDIEVLDYKFQDLRKGIHLIKKFL
ncbi:sulfotransferase family 2 domain-containing protein [Lacinutrix undariae]